MADPAIPSPFLCPKNSNGSVLPGRKPCVLEQRDDLVDELALAGGSALTSGRDRRRSRTFVAITGPETEPGGCFETAVEGASTRLHRLELLVPGTAMPSGYPVCLPATVPPEGRTGERRSGRAARSPLSAYHLPPSDRWFAGRGGDLAACCSHPSYGMRSCGTTRTTRPLAS